MNKDVAFPSVSGYTAGSGNGNGNGGTFAVVGVATVEVCGVRYAGVDYKAEPDGTVSECWTDPGAIRTSTTVPTDNTRTGSVTTTGTTTRTSTLTLTSAGFDGTVDPASVTVTIPGAAKQGKKTVDLVTTVASYGAKKPTTTVVLATPADVDVSKATVTIHWDTVTTSYRAGLVPLDSNNLPVDHIQFRWVGWTGSWMGDGSATCAWTVSSCTGSVGLWR